MVEYLDPVRLARVVASAAVWLWVVAAWPGGRVKRDRVEDQLHLQDRADNFFEQTYDPEQDPNPAPVNQYLHDRLSGRRTASARRPKRASTPPEETCSRRWSTHHRRRRPSQETEKTPDRAPRTSRD